MRRSARNERWRWDQPAMLVVISMLVASTIGCSADNGGGGGGQGGIAPTDDGQVGRDVGELPSDVIHDSRWDAPPETTSLVAPTVPATTCTLHSQCASGFCIDGFCCDNGCANKCMACSAAKKGGGLDGICGSVAANTDPDNDCPAGECDGKNMCKNYNGMACTAASECLSKYCVDGFCCGNICMGACQACSAAKKGGGVDGACGSIKVGTDPDNECSGSCNGAGACDSSPQPTYPNGTACTGASQCQSGFCADGVCCDSWCLGTCQACSAAKKKQGVDGVCGNIAYDQDPDEECWGGGCNGQGVCKQYNGIPCSDKVQCLSNYCVDGFCCGNICTGMCYACSEAKKGQGFDGVCGPIAAGKDVEGECNPGECNGAGACNQPQTPLTNGTACISGGQCASGNCVDGVCCDTVCNGTCLACTTAKKGSGANGTCGPIAAETNPDAECNGGRCDGTGACRYYNGAPCTAKTDCFSNYCVDGLCCGNACLSTCYACSQSKKGGGADGVCGVIGATRDPDNECNPGECNGAGACNQPQNASLANGAACSVGTQCISGNCVDGVCCDTTCTETCKACSATKKGSGADGVCGLIGSTKNPDNECVSGYCNGAGACIYFNGVTCSAASQCISNYCVDGNCCGNICNTACMACTVAKRGGGINGQCGPIANGTDPDNECALTCNGSGACNKAANGSTCTAAADCVSGFCIDGFCCNTACSGLCQTCAAPGAEGTCSNGCVNQCTTTVGLPNAPLTEPQVVPFSGDNIAIETADFNGDGKQDVVVVTKTRNIRVFMGQGNKTFGTPIVLEAAASAAAVAAKDLNADGRVDIVVASNGTAGMSVFLNQGNGVFSARVDYVTAAVSTSYNVPDIVRIADVNGDGIQDVATANTADSSVSMRLGQGDGTFPNVSYIVTPSTPSALAVGNLNGDAIVDFAVANQDSATMAYRVSVYPGQGSGAFGTATHYTVDRRIISLTTADVNGDGRLDLVGLGEDSPGAGKVYVLISQAGGTFANAVSTAVAGSGRLIAANLNGDAFADIAVATRLSKSVAVFLGQASGTLGAVTEYAAANTAYALAAADVDNDMDNDIVTANIDSLSVLSNSGTGTLTLPLHSGTKLALGGKFISNGDLNGDGLRDLVSVDSSGQTVTTFFGQMGGSFVQAGTQSIAPQIVTEDFVLADMNGDSKLDMVYQYQGSVILRFGQGNGSFGAPNAYSGFYVRSGKPAVADIDGNGTLDVALTGMFSAPATGHIVTHDMIVTWFNPGNGVLGAAVSNEFSSSWDSPDSSDCTVVAGDFNGDGKFDAVPYGTRVGTQILLSQGNGQYTWASGMGATLNQRVADVNGDGAVDLIGRISANGEFTTNVWLNAGAGTLGSAIPYPDMGQWLETGDLNGDSLVDLVATFGSQLGVMLNQGNGVFGTVKMYPTTPGSAELTLGDWNGNDRLDIAVQGSSFITIHDNTCLP